MGDFARDLRHALRIFLRRPTFTLAALLALGLGVGANTAIFSAFDAVLLTPPDYPEPERLVRLWEVNPAKGQTASPMSPVAFADISQRSKSFAGLAGWWFPDHNLTSGEGDPERVRAINTTDAFFDVLAVLPQLGRGFAPGEDARGRPLIAVLSHRLWQRRYGGRGDILQQQVRLDGRDYQIVGVMPPGFDFPRQTDAWLPLGWNPANHSRSARFFNVVGRLAPGVSVGAAKAEVADIAASLARDFPASNEGWEARLETVPDDLVAEVRGPLRLLLWAVFVVLLIACVNVANLLLAQAASRQREVALRGALGAGRWRLVRQFLTESLVLGLGGGLLGLGLAYAGIRLLRALAPSGTPRIESLSIDWRMLGYTLVVALFSSLLFGLVPAFFGTRVKLVDSLKEGARSVAGGSRRWLRDGLVVLEVGLAVVLMLAAGLLVRSFYQVLAESPGFSPQNLLSFNVQLPRSTYEEWSAVTSFYDRLVERLAGKPQVEGSAVTSFLPLEAGWRINFLIDGQREESDRDQPEAQYRPVSPGYFRLLSIALLEGRDFSNHDDADQPGVVILNRAAVDRYFAGQSPLGEILGGQTRAIGPLGRVLTEGLEVEVVGVVANVKNSALEAAPEPAIYFPQRQFAYRAMNVMVRVRGDLNTALAAVQAAVWELDRQLPLADLRTLEQRLDAAVAKRRFVMLLLSAFAILALLLAAIGTYGVMSYIAGQRRREMGIRIALGARPGDVLRLLVSRGLLLAVLGAVLGLVVAWPLRGYLSEQLYGVATTDWPTLVGALSLLLLAALLASFPPAQRAARRDPSAALRLE